MIALFLRPFTSAEPGSIGELLEVLGFVYCFLSLMAPVIWYAWRGIDDPNRLRRYLKLFSVPVVWPFVVATWGIQAVGPYFHSHFLRELQELIPEREAPRPLKSPRELGLWD